MARDHVLSLRLNDDEYAQIAKLAGPEPISDIVRGMLFDHLAEPPRCWAVKPGNWSSLYLPICALPRGHEPLDHWWRHDASKRVETWR